MSYLIFQSPKLLSFNFKFRKIFSLYFHKMSQNFPPVKEKVRFPKDSKSNSKSQQLMLAYGIISHQHDGLYGLMPLGLRAVEKLIKNIDYHLAKANCKKLILPNLTSTSLWKLSGRLDTCESEVFRLKDRHEKEFILSPTHEEAITYLLSTTFPFAHTHLPLRLYQITSKFRDERRPKHGLLRGREFLMKDLYTFDTCLENAKITYEEIVCLYTEIFKSLDIPVIKVQASVGSIGGTESHEFHIETSIGEDSLLSCTRCSFKTNSELMEKEIRICPDCNGELMNTNGIEIGQSFLLGTEFSKPMSAYYQTVDGKKLLYMGCYGIGVTRLLAAGIEALSNESYITWPTGIAPFKVCVIPPKKDSKENPSILWTEYLVNVINKIPGYGDEVIIDDRIKLSLGERVNYAKRFGFPLIIVIGKAAQNEIPHFEVIHQNKTFLMSQADMLHYLQHISNN